MTKNENNFSINQSPPVEDLGGLNFSVLFLGTGTSTGVPEIGCSCAVCQSADTKDKRLRASILLCSKNETVLIDCGPDFREQMLTHHVNQLDAILLTHEHYDHISGLDDVRPLGNMNLYAQERVLQAVKNNMPYSFRQYDISLKVPKLALHTIDNEPFSVGNFTFQPIQLMHLNLLVLGFRTENFAYLTDFNAISEQEFEKLHDLDILVIDALRIKPHPSHNTLEQALNFIQKINPRRAYLTHISHGMGLHQEVQQTLPENVFLAYDGLKIQIY